MVVRETFLRPSLAVGRAGRGGEGRVRTVRSMRSNHVSRRTLLGVWAHPDDEAYTSAGLMAEFRRRGDRVVVVTATLGERGTSDPTTWPPARLAALRHAELRNSLATLDVDELHVLGYEDGGCDRRDGTAAIAGVIADIEPDLIVTFGPDGMTGHPDHRAISRWTTEAWATTRPAADAVVRHRHARVPPRVGPDQRPDRPVGRPARTAVHRRGRPGAQHPAGRRPARPQDRRARRSCLADPTPHRAARPRDLPRVVAYRILPERRRASVCADAITVRIHSSVTALNQAIATRVMWTPPGSGHRPRMSERS